MTDRFIDVFSGIALTTIIIVAALTIAGWMAVNDKREACTKFAEITEQQTTFITYGLTESLCFTSINGKWTDINPQKVNP
jgi:uncharacterized protein YbdZ (MbtH family)